MKKYIIMQLHVAVLVIAITFISGSCGKRAPGENFSFVFMTDIHLSYERNSIAGFKKAILSVDSIKPDFVITGGDLIMDALGQRYSLADSLYDLYIETIKDLKMPVYNTIGNHEMYGIYSSSGSDRNNPEYGEKMFESRIGKSYYSFDHKGWKFMVLNSIEDTGRDRYIGMIDNEQIKWIKEELRETDKKTPIVISTHIPFLTANTQKYKGTTVPNDSSTVIYNAKEVLELFNGHNLRLVLQGHLHTIENIYIDGIHFLTGGAVSGGWWNGPNRNFEEGFMLMTIEGDDIAWKYVDYGWNVKNPEE